MSIRRLGWITAAALWSGWGCASYAPIITVPGDSNPAVCVTSAEGRGHFSKPHYASARQPLRGGRCVATPCSASDLGEFADSPSPAATPLPTTLSSASYEISFPATQHTLAASSVSEHAGSQIDWDQADLLDVTCRAARSAAVANAIAAQRDWFRDCDTDQCSRSKVDELFALAELRERQLAAEKAGILLVNNARLQCQQSLLDEVDKEIHRILKSIEQLAEIQSEAADTYSLDLQLTELEEQQATLTARSIEVQSRLRQLLALPPNQHRPLRVNSLPDWTPATQSEDLVQTAIENRPDLQATRKLTEIDTLGLNIDLTSQMAGIHPLLAVRLLAEASETPVLDFLAGKHSEADPHCEPRLQGRNLEEEQTRDITAEVTTIEGELFHCEQRIQAINARIQLMQANKSELEKAVSIGRVNYPRWVEVSLGELAARGELIDAVSDLHIQLIKLQSATGTIATDCEEPAPANMPPEAISAAVSASVNATLPARSASAIHQRLAELESSTASKFEISALATTNSIVDSFKIGPIIEGQVASPVSSSSILSKDSSQRRTQSQRVNQPTPAIRQADYQAPQASLGPVRLLSTTAPQAADDEEEKRDDSTSVVRKAPSVPGLRKLRLSPMLVENPVSTAPDK